MVREEVVKVEAMEDQVDWVMGGVAGLGEGLEEGLGWERGEVKG
jgi:hypothetical protein